MRNTSEISAKPDSEPTAHSLTFELELARLVVKYQKWTTWRVGEDRDVQTGDKLMLQLRDGVSKRTFGTAEVSAVNQRTFGTLTEADFEGHEKFAGNEELLDTYRRYYGDQVNETTSVKVIHFEPKVLATNPDDLDETDVVVISSPHVQDIDS